MINLTLVTAQSSLKTTYRANDFFSRKDRKGAKNFIFPNYFYNSDFRSLKDLGSLAKLLVVARVFYSPPSAEALRAAPPTTSSF